MLSIDRLALAYPVVTESQYAVRAAFAAMMLHSEAGLRRKACRISMVLIGML